MSSPILFALASVIWGSTFWAITLQLGHVAPAVSVAYRFAIAAITLFICCAIRGDRLWLPWRTQGWMFVQGMCSFSLSYVCTYSAEQTVISGLVAILFTLMVIWNPIGERIFYRHPLTWRIWIAGLMAMLGVSLLFSQPLLESWQNLGTGGSNSGFLFGIVLALLATLASSAGNLLVMQVRKQSSNVLLTTAWAMLWGSLLVGLYVTFSGQEWHLPGAASYWVSLIYLALFGSVIAFTAYFVLIDRIGGHKAVYVGVVTPVISVLLSIQFEHYRPGLLEWLGMALCLAGVAVILRGESAPEPQAIQPNQSLS